MNPGGNNRLKQVVVCVYWEVAVKVDLKCFRITAIVLGEKLEFSFIH